MHFVSLQQNCDQVDAHNFLHVDVVVWAYQVDGYLDSSQVSEGQSQFAKLRFDWLGRQLGAEEIVAGRSFGNFDSKTHP